MKDNYLINIEGFMERQGDVDKVRLLTKGGFFFKNGNYFITYEEAKENGYEGSVTTVKVENESKVSMLRFGKMPSQLVIERGRRHVCHYETGQGALTFGVAADAIENNLNAQGGNLTFSYTLDSGNSQISYNQVKIKVQEAN